MRLAGSCCFKRDPQCVQHTLLSSGSDFRCQSKKPPVCVCVRGRTMPSRIECVLWSDVLLAGCCRLRPGSCLFSLCLHFKLHCVSRCIGAVRCACLVPMGK